jgi:hypothetical protein
MSESPIGDTTSERPPHRSFTAVIESYRLSMARHQEDLDAAIHDLQYQIQHGQILHAVDFTELNAYVLPRDASLVKSLTTEQDAFEQVALDLATLNAIFFGSEEGAAPPVILLPPHRYELRHAEYFYYRASFARFRELAESAQEELRKVHLDVELEQLLATHQQASNQFEKSAAEQHLLAYLNQHASSLLLAITYESSASAQARLSQLLQRGHIIDLSSSEALGRQIEQDELDLVLVADIQRSISRRRQSRLSSEAKSRMVVADYENLERRSRRDAFAVAYVLHANDLLLSSQDKGGWERRIILLTRSEAVISAVRTYSRQKSNIRLPYYIRRPTATIAALLEPSSNLDEQLANLKQRQRSLELARHRLDTIAEDLKPSGAKVHKQDHEIESQISELRSLWKDAVNLSVAASDWHLEAPAKRSDLTKLIPILRYKAGFSEVIAQAAAQLTANISMNSALLGHIEPRSDSNLLDSARMERPKARSKSRRRTFIWIRDASSTIGLYFYHPLLRSGRRNDVHGMKVLKKLLHVRPQKEIRARAGVGDDDFEETADMSAEPALVEACLASSFLEAIAENWVLAEMYAEMSVNWSEKLDSTPKHEAYYMQALCRLRAENPTPERIRAGLEDLDTAREIFRREFETDNDPRFLLERGKHYFRFWEHIDLRPEGQPAKQPPDRSAFISVAPLGPVNENFQKAMRLFDQAAGLLGEQRRTTGEKSPSILRQLVDVANARCYAYIAGMGPDAKAFELLIQLLQAIGDCGWSNRTVPVAILDTVCWTMYCVRDRLQDSGLLASTAAELARRYKEYRRPEKDKLALNAHLIIIENTLKLGLKWT